MILQKHFFSAYIYSTFNNNTVVDIVEKEIKVSTAFKSLMVQYYKILVQKELQYRTRCDICSDNPKDYRFKA